MLSRKVAPVARAARFLGSASLIVLGSSIAALGQTAPADSVPEQVLVTGSLIHGTAAVGVPVTQLSLGDFGQTGAVTVSDLLKSSPALYIPPTPGNASGGGNFERNANIDIHDLNHGITVNGNPGVRTLMLIDGMRYPLQKHDGTGYDPSIVPQLAIQNIDVLADGASATYGSDAVAGVVNVILKRRFEGAISEVRVGDSDSGGFNYQLAQLYGRKWDSGDITVSLEYYDLKSTLARKTKGYTFDFTPWGLNNLTPIGADIPAIITIPLSGAAAVGPLTAAGAAANTVYDGCANCYSIPSGIGWNYGDTAAHTNPTAPGSAPTTSWANILGNKNINNVINPYQFGDYDPGLKKTSGTVTFDQNIIRGVEAFLTGIYSNRRIRLLYPSSINPYVRNNLISVTVPTTNPYYPTGAPANLRVNYDFDVELPPVQTAAENSREFTGGFNLELPYQWLGKVFANFARDSGFYDQSNYVNRNNLIAALGGVVPASGPTAGHPGSNSWTKPDGIPYLNLFCDPFAYQCNSPTTLAWLSGVSAGTNDSRVYQYGANFDGPLFDLPGGTVRAAIGGDYVEETFDTTVTQSRNSLSAQQPDITTENLGRKSFAFFAQGDIPLVGDANALPLVRRLDLQASYRYDHYSDFGGTGNPKFALDWVPTDGLTLRGSWGTAFHAPIWKNFATSTGRTIQQDPETIGVAGVCPTVGAPAVPGSAAAVLNPTCSAALQHPIGMIVGGGTGGILNLLRPGKPGVGPETATTWSTGIEYAPTNNFLEGLDLEATLYRVNIKNVIAAFQSQGMNNPAFRFTYIIRGVDMNDAAFNALATALLNNPVNQFVGGTVTSVQYINDAVFQNLGSEDQEGIDFTASYVWDMGDFGSGNAGIVGNYKFHDVLNPGGDILHNAFGHQIDAKLRYRGRVGWADEQFSATVFVNYFSHIFDDQDSAPPAPFLAQFPSLNVNPFTQLIPSYYTFDLAFGYNTRSQPANDYLKNINIQLVLNNVFNRAPPFVYHSVVGSSGVSTFLGQAYAVEGRTISLAITKSW